MKAKTKFRKAKKVTKFPRLRGISIPGVKKNRLANVKKLESMDVMVTQPAFFEILRHVMDDQNLEIAGYAYMKDNIIVWADLAEMSKQSGTGVTSCSAKSVMAALEAGYGVPNCHYHTHPFGSAFHSATDVNMEMDIVEQKVKSGGSGRFTFVVIASLEWIARTYTWSDGKINGFHDGHVIVNGIKLDFGGGYSYYHSYGGNYYDYGTANGGNDVSNDGAGKVGGYEYSKYTGRPSYYMASYLDEESDYDELFDTFKVDKYDWVSLKAEIDRIYGICSYWEIVSDASIWKHL